MVFLHLSQLILLNQCQVRSAICRISDDLMDKNDIIPAPEDPEQWQDWRDALNSWKRKKQSQLNYDGSSYRSEPFEWVTTCFPVVL